MTIDSVRSVAWSALQDPATTGAELAAIAADHPEFAGAIARHPHAYPELVEWARAAAAHSTASAAVEPALREDAAPPPRRVLGRRLWAAVLLVLVAVPVLVSIVHYAGPEWGEGSSIGEFWLYGMSPLSPTQLLMVVVHALAVVAAALSAATTARRVWSIVLVAVAWAITFGVTFLGSPWWWPLWDLLWGPVFLLIVVVWASLLFVAWGLSRPLRGAGYAALPIVVVVPLLLEWLAWPFVRYWWGAGDWFQFGLRGVATLLVGSVAIPVAGVYLARLWSLASERRAAQHAVRLSGIAAAPAYDSGIAASDRTNTMAILSLVLAFVFSIPAVILGHVSLNQIRRTGEQGRGLAIAGLVLGYLGIAGGVIVAIVWVVLLSTIRSSYPY